MLLIPKEKIDDFIEELVDSILENISAELEIVHLKGAMFESFNEEWVIPEDELRATIREVFDRWLENEES